MWLSHSDFPFCWQWGWHACARASLFQPIHGLALQGQSRACRQRADGGWRLCVYGWERVRGGGGGETHCCGSKCRAGIDTPHKGNTQPGLAGLSIPLRLPSHGTETSSALWKGMSEQYVSKGGSVWGKGRVHFFLQPNANPEFCSAWNYFSLGYWSISLRRALDSYYIQ